MLNITGLRVLKTFFCIMKGIGFILDTFLRKETNKSLDNSNVYKVYE